MTQTAYQIQTEQEALTAVAWLKLREVVETLGVESVLTELAAEQPEPTPGELPRIDALVNEFGYESVLKDLQAIEPKEVWEKRMDAANEYASYEADQNTLY